MDVENGPPLNFCDTCIDLISAMLSLFSDYWAASQNIFWEKCTHTTEKCCSASFNERETRSQHVWNKEVLWSWLWWCVHACLWYDVYSHI